jgi:hypothetical protein
MPPLFGGADDCTDGTVNQVDSANQMIGGLYYPWYGTNAADPTGIFPPAADLINGTNSFTWYWTNAINLNAVSSPGDFGSDSFVPGIPTADGVAARPNDSFSIAFDSYIAFPSAGFYVLGVDSDDAFRYPPLNLKHNRNLNPLSQMSQAGHAPIQHRASRNQDLAVMSQMSGQFFYSAGPPYFP